MGFEHGEGYLLKLMLLSRYIAKNLRMLPRPYLTHLYLNNVVRPYYILKTSSILTEKRFTEPLEDSCMVTGTNR